jgi:hypothetical protein
MRRHQPIFWQMWGIRILLLFMTGFSCDFRCKDKYIFQNAKFTLHNFGKSNPVCLMGRPDTVEKRRNDGAIS